MKYFSGGAYHGKIIYSNLSFLGEFMNGKRHGDGLFTYPNGDIYSG